jgi:hypothetical protein
MMFKRWRVGWALTALTLLFAGLHANTLASQSGPSLDDTLKWLKDFLPGATGAVYQDHGQQSSETTSLDVSDGCKVHIKSVGTPGSYWEEDDFSFAEIEPSTVVVELWQGTTPQAFHVVMETRGKENTVISRSPLGNRRFDVAGAGTFVDRAVAERVANAFRHAAELCAKTQPF